MPKSPPDRARPSRLAGKSVLTRVGRCCGSRPPYRRESPENSSFPDPTLGRISSFCSPYEKHFVAQVDPLHAFEKLGSALTNPAQVFAENLHNSFGSPKCRIR